MFKSSENQKSLWLFTPSKAIRRSLKKSFNERRGTGSYTFQTLLSSEPRYGMFIIYGRHINEVKTFTRDCSKFYDRSQLLLKMLSIEGSKFTLSVAGGILETNCFILI
jgi:hypothetical protein